MLYCCTSPSSGRRYATVATSDAESITPSVMQNPTARSKSFPGVRIVTTSDSGSCPGPCTRISIGSSVTSRSEQSRARSPSTARTAADAVEPRAVGFVLSAGNVTPLGRERAAEDAAAAGGPPIGSEDRNGFDGRACRRGSRSGAIAHKNVQRFVSSQSGARSWNCR